ncbi:MAG: MarR family transcriptional regulator [Porphyromonadaceae bacterium CG2_30_38_12]|nr:MAG: MarR family transcriptional regulator [Porphyromonadaceae bacterium CG2_30_38_12]
MLLEDEIKGRFRNEYHKGLINLTYTTKLLGYEFYQALKKHNITEQQYNVLRILRGYRDQAPLTIGFIKERMLDKDSDVSRLVDRLYRNKYLSRCENEVDRRQKSVAIADKGLELLNSMLECEKKVDKLLANLTDEEVKQLNYLLDKIRAKS